MSVNKRANGANTIYQDFVAQSMIGRNQSQDRQVILENMYIRVLTELAMNRFKWSNMPDSIDVRFLELTLFRSALSIFYFDKRYNKFMAVQGNGFGPINHVANPKAFRVISPNFDSIELSARKCVPIWANYLRTPDHDIVSIYAFKLAQIDRTIEINVNNARRNKVVVAEENTRLSASNFNRQLDEGQQTLYIDPSMSSMMPIALDLGVDADSIEKLSILRGRLWSECMGLLGIENANQDKKERLVASEVDANEEQTSSSKNVNLNARKIAAKQINDKYGLDIEVEYHTEADNQMNSVVSDYETPKEDDNANVHA